MAERRVIRIADPDGGRQRWREADRPVVAEGLGGPGLGGDVPARQRQVAVTAERHAAIAVIGHDRGDDERDLRADRPGLVLRRVVGEDVAAGGVLDRQQRRRHVADPERGQRRDARRHVDGRHLVAAERQAERVILIGLRQMGHAHPPGGAEHVRNPDPQLRLHRRDVQRVAHRHLERQHAVVPEVVVQRDVRLKAAGAAPGRKDQGRIEDGRDHVELPAFDGGRIRVDLEGRPRLAGPVRHVDPATRPVVVVAADHGEDLAGLGIHADQRGVVKVVEVAFLRDLIPDHLLGDVLQVEIQ